MRKRPGGMSGQTTGCSKARKKAKACPLARLTVRSGRTWQVKGHADNSGGAHSAPGGQARGAPMLQGGRAPVLPGATLAGSARGTTRLALACTHAPRAGALQGNHRVNPKLRLTPTGQLTEHACTCMYARALH